MKTIGFVDLYIGEWHADNYPAWIGAANEKLGTDYRVGYVWAEQDVSPVTGETTDAWCRRMDAQRCDSLAELCEKSDVIMILAPSDPEKHLAYAEVVLPFGKRTYIDKTFAPDLATAKQIFRIAKAHGTPFFSTSALRFADELERFRGTEGLSVTAGGSDFEEYLIHPVEMAVKLLADPAEQAKVEVCGEKRVCHIITRQGKTAAITFSPALGYTVSGTDAAGERICAEVTSDYFAHLLTEILRFYESGELPFDPAQTLEVMRLRTLLLRAQKTPGVWVNDSGKEPA